MRRECGLAPLRKRVPLLPGREGVDRSPQLGLLQQVLDGLDNQVNGHCNEDRMTHCMCCHSKVCRQ